MPPQIGSGGNLIRRSESLFDARGSGVDGTVRRISLARDVRGLVTKITCWDNPTVGQGNVVNEVVLEQNDLGMSTKEYQEHKGAKDANTLYVGYNWDETASGGVFTKGLRPTSLRPPTGRLVFLNYGTAGGMNDILSRLEAIKDDSGGSPGATLASYLYVGLGLIVVEDYEEPDVKLDLFGGTSGTYAGFDRFTRVKDHRWYDYGASADRDRYKYGYDRASNRTYRENVVSKNLGTPVYLDEFYTYDGLSRLATFDRGQLNGTYTGITGTPSKEEDFTLDALGNHSGYVMKTSGTTDLSQSRGVNKANEITSITETVGPSWIDPVYDKNGNMTTIPKRANLAQGLTGKFDAWNRLVEVKDGSTVIAAHKYDGLHRRIEHDSDSQAPASPNGIDKYEHLFYNRGWQLVETRETTTESDQPESLQPKYQYIWSPRYIDACILRDKNTDSDGLCDDERLYYLNDANMNVTCLTDTAGDAVERSLYAPFGGPQFFDASWAARTVSAYDSRLLFAGYLYDPQTGLYLARFRYFHSVMGLWVQRDPLDEITNAYAYVLNNPIVFVDSQGLQITYPKSECEKCCCLLIVIQYKAGTPSAERRGDIAGNEDILAAADELENSKAFKESCRYYIRLGVGFWKERVILEDKQAGLKLLDNPGRAGPVSSGPGGSNQRCQDPNQIKIKSKVSGPNTRSRWRCGHGRQPHLSGATSWDRIHMNRNSHRPSDAITYRPCGRERARGSRRVAVFGRRQIFHNLQKLASPAHSSAGNLDRVQTAKLSVCKTQRETACPLAPRALSRPAEIVVTLTTFSGAHKKSFPKKVEC